MIVAPLPHTRSRSLLALAHGLLLILAATGLHTAQAAEPSIAGRWDASVEVGVMHVPFPFQIAVHKGAVAGWFFNGQEQIVSTGGSFKGGHLVLEFPTYARRLEATLGSDGTLSGSYLPTTPGVIKATPYAFKAHRAGAAKDEPHPPNISGEWLIAVQSEKAGEKSWRLIVHQAGSNVKATMLRVDGDSGELTGSWHEGSLLLSHFDGARPAVLEVRPAEGGALELLVRDRKGQDKHLTAYRAQEARAKGVADTADPMQHTRMKDPHEPFRFSFPDLDGHTVSNTDSRFRGKVLVVDIGGSWCPNCHDEAPLLEDLYKKYRQMGLEIVTLSFEDEQEQLTHPVRLRAFMKRYALDYTVLLAGTTEQLNEKIPQAEGLDSYPTTFFIGRDGRVRAVHTGFAAAVTGQYNTHLKYDFEREIIELLAEKAPAVTAAHKP